MTEAHLFLYHFLSRVTEDAYDRIYREDESAFTGAVIGEINGIIRDMGYVPQNEYFRIDAVGWVSRWQEIAAEAASVGLRPHLWDLQIAVEHENDRTDWTDELIKLMHIRCPLKVIIGYNHCDCREAPETEKLAAAARWMQRIRALPQEDEEYLILLGNCAAKYDRTIRYTSFGYRGYLYHHRDRMFRRCME
ncbi:MAG: hypothetical protein IJ480_09710 [Clostridia bacterium]|nr:hypothetical protein [Clostridia bacterium]